MNCDQFKSNIFGFTEETLPRELHASMDVHIASCPSCAQLLAEFKALEEIILKEKAGEPSPFAATRLLQRTETEFLSRGRSHSQTYTRILQPVAIAVALLCGIAIGFYTAGNGKMQADSPGNSAQNILFLKSNLFISDFADEDKTLVLNK